MSERLKIVAMLCATLILCSAILAGCHAYQSRQARRIQEDALDRIQQAMPHR